MPQYQGTIGLNKAKSNPVIASGAVDPVDESELGRGQDRVMRSTGDAKDALDEPKLVVAIDSPLEGLDQEKLAMEAFMNEKITIHVHDTSDPNADQVFEININGRPELFKRGEQKTCKRYYVDHILRMKAHRVKQTEVINNEGIRQFVHKEQPYLVYPVSLIHDANPLGRSWFDFTQKNI